ncbi:MAG TPA: hypothetical protein VH186_34640 [Chloroflexia bacterium]|nr:hypothetical protein [Chloroflexia bacterium]
MTLNSKVTHLTTQIQETPLVERATIPGDQTLKEKEIAPSNHATAKINTGKSGFPFPGAALGLLVLSLLAGGLRISLAGIQSAYLDEAAQILAGRYLIERHQSYGQLLNWSYGSYLWPLLAGTADIAGGLFLVRGLAALLGVIAVLATVFSAYRLAPSSYTGAYRWGAALLAGLFMAVFPTAIAIGRFGTYDALAAAGFMLGIALLFPTEGRFKVPRLLLAAGLLFAGFLAKYLLAIYFPFICLYLLIAPRSHKTRLLHMACFILPLSALCAAYFLLFQSELTTLLTFSKSYSDLKSSNPLQEYIWQRPEIWVLAGLAFLAWPMATKIGKQVALAGCAVILAFQLISRPDFDFWKHSIYLIFFLSPMVGLLLASWLRPLFLTRAVPGISVKAGQRQILPLLIIGLICAAGIGLSVTQALKLVTYYPDLNSAMPAIHTYTNGQARVLTDDPALRYYLYPQIPSEQVIDPYFFNYRKSTGMASYRNAISDRYFDAIVLDGGIGPSGPQLKRQVSGLIMQNYQRVYSGKDQNGNLIEIYTPPACQFVTSSTSGLKLFNFDSGTSGWGGRPEGQTLHAGEQVVTSKDETCEGHSTLKFTPDNNTTDLSVALNGQVNTIKAEVYIKPEAALGLSVPVGMFGFDQNWQWHDDGFKQLVPTGRWIELTWQLSNPGTYREIGLKFPKGTTVVYIGQVTVS